jgi:hypothetical protein
MSYRDWLLHPPVTVGLAVAITLLAAGLLPQDDKPKDQRKATPTQQTENRAAKPVGAPPIEQAVEIDWNQPKCDQAKSHDPWPTAGHCAQR